MPKQLTTGPSTNSNPEWSADGKWIYFTSDREGRDELWKVPVGGGKAVRVTEVPNGGGTTVESRDGKFLYYEKGYPDDWSIWRVPINGGEETLVVDSLHPEGGHVIVKNGIYFISKPDEKGVSSIRFKDFASGSVRTIVPIKGRVFWGLAVSPDQQTLLCAHTSEGEGSVDLMLVENFR